MPICLAVAGLASSALAGSEYRMESVSRAGPGPVTADVYLRWDGNGQSSYSSFVVNLSSPSPDLTIQITGIAPDPLGFKSVNITYNANTSSAAVTGTNLEVTGSPDFPIIGKNDSLTDCSERLLTEVTFDATTAGVFPIALSLTSATRTSGPIFHDCIASEVVLIPGTITISAIPDPAALSLLAGGAILALRRGPR